MDFGDIARKIGVGVLMIVPTFVGGGALWAMMHSWVAVIIWIIIMGALGRHIILEKLSNA